MSARGTVAIGEQRAAELDAKGGGTRLEVDLADGHVELRAGGAAWVKLSASDCRALANALFDAARVCGVVGDASAPRGGGR